MPHQTLYVSLTGGSPDYIARGVVRGIVQFEDCHFASPQEACEYLRRTYQKNYRLVISFDYHNEEAHE